MYETLARYYDHLHEALTEDVPLILALAREKGDLVLELGCGSGRLLLPLADAGHTTMGLDNSPAMLALARQRLAAAAPEVAARVTPVEGDILALPPAVMQQRYNLIVIPYNTLLHFTQREVGHIFAQVAGLLESQGAVFIDLVNPFAFDSLPDEREPALEARLHDAESGAIVEQWSTIRVEAGAQTAHVRWAFRDTALAAADTVVEMAYHYLFPHQLELQLRQGGLRLESLWGDYDRRPFAAESERLLAVASGAGRG